jgi:hypothetical protein
MEARQRAAERSAERTLAAALLAVIALRAATLTVMPLVDTDDSRYAEVGRQMVMLGDWVTPHFSPEMAFWGKPPLHFWATELAARLPSFVGGLGVPRLARNAGLELAAQRPLVQRHGDRTRPGTALVRHRRGEIAGLPALLPRERCSRPAATS